MIKPSPTDKEIVLNSDKIIITKADTKGYIIYTNDYFCEISGYTKEELNGVNHDITHHQDMPSAIFNLLWENISVGKPFKAILKNLAKNGNFYWGLADIQPYLDPITNKIEHHTSYVKSIQKSIIDDISRLYKNLKEKEQIGGVESSRVFLDDYLKLNNTTYDRYIDKLLLQESHTKSMFDGLKGMFGKK